MVQIIGNFKNTRNKLLNNYNNGLRALTSQMRGHLPIVGNKNLDVHLGEKSS